MKIFVVVDSNTVLNVVIKCKRELLIYSEYSSFDLTKNCNNSNHLKKEHELIQRCEKESSDLLASKQQLQINCFYFGKLLKELADSPIYRKNFIKNYTDLSKLNGLKNVNLTVKLEYSGSQIIDYGWEYRCNYLLQEKEHLNSAMSWLSTLGGAFSALGDFDSGFADRACVTSYKQMLIACRLGDSNLISRCWLYCSLSLIQKKKFKKAAAIIKFVFDWAKYTPEGKVDHRIVNMCHGIWIKLKYERALMASNFIQKNATSRKL